MYKLSSDNVPMRNDLEKKRLLWTMFSLDYGIYNMKVQQNQDLDLNGKRKLLRRLFTRVYPKVPGLSR
jgi:hypothetical protein